MLKAGEIQVIYRPKRSAHPSLITSEVIYELLKNEIYDLDTIGYRESFTVLFCDSGLKLIRYSKMFDGALDCVMVDVRMIMQHALLCNATSIILAHNHPSGSLRPSSQDDAITRKICDAARLLDLRVTDHLIITEESYYSYSDKGRL